MDLVIGSRRQRLAKGTITAAKEISVKKYVVRLSREERERLENADPERKEPVEAAVERAHSVEGRCAKRLSRNANAIWAAARLKFQVAHLRIARSDWELHDYSSRIGGGGVGVFPGHTYEFAHLDRHKRI